MDINKETAFLGFMQQECFINVIFVLLELDFFPIMCCKYVYAFILLGAFSNPSLRDACLW